MKEFTRLFGLCLVAVLVVSCATAMQGRFSMLGQSYPPKPAGFDVQIFRDDLPKRPYVKISRLIVHIERTLMGGSSSIEDALPELKEQARLSGADAIIDIQQSVSSVAAETEIFNVTATGIRYTSPQ